MEAVSDLVNFEALVADDLMADGLGPRHVAMQERWKLGTRLLSLMHRLEPQFTRFQRDDLTWPDGREEGAKRAMG